MLQAEQIAAAPVPVGAICRASMVSVQRWQSESMVVELRRQPFVIRVGCFR
jgi:hypothetical protein